MIQKTRRLMKFKRLKRRLGLGMYEAVGLLETLWLETAEQTPGGDIGALSDAEIVDLLEWDRSPPEELIAALVELGWLDRDGDRHERGVGWRLLVHDWHEHCPNHIKGNAAKYHKPFCGPNGGTLSLGASQGGSQEASPSSLGASQGHSQGGSLGASQGRSLGRSPLPNHTKPDHTKPNHPESPQGSLGGESTTERLEGVGGSHPRGDAETDREQLRVRLRGEMFRKDPDGMRALSEAEIECRLDALEAAVMALPESDSE